MISVEAHVIPRYTRDHFAHYKQVFEWYLDKDKNKEQVLAFHLDRERHFHQWIKETGNRTDVTSTGELIED